LEKLNNFTTSYVRDTIFGDPDEDPLMKEYLSNYRFKDSFANIFANQFIILSRLGIKKEQFSGSKKTLLKYLKLESELAWFNLKQFCNFLSKKGNLFEATELVDILKIAIYGDKYGLNKYKHLIERTAKAISKFHPDCKIDNLKLIQLAILKCSSDSNNNSNYQHLIPLIKVCAENCKEVLLNTFEIQLDNKFNSDLYEALLEKADYDYKKKNYFQIYAEHINASKGVGAFKYGKRELTDLVFIHFAYILYKMNVDFDSSALNAFSNLNDFESWLINPPAFDYNKFDAKWLTDLDDTTFINRFKSNSKIKTAIDLELENSFDPVLAEIRYKHFAT
jgi:hypothetical protein